MIKRFSLCLNNAIIKSVGEIAFGVAFIYIVYHKLLGIV